MNISSKDRILGNQINQIMNEYDNISQNLYQSKMQYLNKVKPRNFSLNNFNYINRNNYYNSHYNDYDLQRRISNSLYPYKNTNIISQRYTPSYMTYLSNKNKKINNYMTNNNYEQSSNSSNLIEDFKNTLMTTQALTNKIMTKTNFYKNNNNNFNENINYDNSDISKNSSNHYIYSEENDSSINLDEISDDINNIEDNYDKFKYNYTYKFINNDLNNKKPIFNYKQNEEDNLKESNKNLKKINQDLLNQNRILEVEITNYKIHENNLKGKSPFTTQFDENLQKFISSLKKEYKESVNKNLETAEQIFDFQKEIEDILNKNKNLGDEHSKIARKIEQENRKRAEIQIMNEENEKKITNLNIEKNNLNDE